VGRTAAQAGFVGGLRPIPLDKRRGTDDTAPASPDLLRPVATALADIPALALTESVATGPTLCQPYSLVAPIGRFPDNADPLAGPVPATAGGRVIGVGRLPDGLRKPERIP
jgi:tRNA pseudouridine55 synthase